MRLLLIVICLLAAACGPRAETGNAARDAERAAIEVMASVDPGMPLDQMLLLLDEYLAAAQTAALDDDGQAAFLRAEAVSDRLLQARMPFEWIPDEEYNLGSRLRQVQSMSDRVLALIQTAAPRATALEELDSLRADVIELRHTLAQGGTQAPPSIEMLLAGDSSRQAISQPAAQAEPAATDQPGLLGTPIRQ